MHNKVHIAGRGSVVRQLRILASQFHVLRTGTLFEIRPDNMYQPSDCAKTSFHERIIWVAGFNKNEILKPQWLNFTFQTDCRYLQGYRSTNTFEKLVKMILFKLDNFPIQRKD
ncbi:hypothetical protein [Sunxiuqinia indica]|uniref:hypothetical protein n=1 Tax=Sunxiuqinia indica TaxID=2692584 RepID=UPI0013576EA9|nr:hypothetical protein [Sunxiuqinia indica]